MTKILLIMRRNGRIKTQPYGYEYENFRRKISLFQNLLI